MHDSTRAFDRVRHDIIKHVTDEEKWTRSTDDQKHVTGTDGSNARRWGNKLIKKKIIIKRGVRLGCVLSPDLSLCTVK